MTVLVDDDSVVIIKLVSLWLYFNQNPNTYIVLTLIPATTTAQQDWLHPTSGTKEQKKERKRALCLKSLSSETRPQLPQSEDQGNNQSVINPHMIMQSHKLHKHDKKINEPHFCDRLFGSFAKRHVVCNFIKKIYKPEKCWCLCFISSSFIKIFLHTSQLVLSDVHDHFHKARIFTKKLRPGLGPTEVGKSRMIEHCMILNPQAPVKHLKVPYHPWHLHYTNHMEE